MKVLVTGVKGQLGHDVVNELEKRGHTAVGVDIEEMDITDFTSVKKTLTAVSPEAVIHCAAWTAVDAAEDTENQEKHRTRVIPLFISHWCVLLSSPPYCPAKNSVSLATSALSSSFI